MANVFPMAMMFLTLVCDFVRLVTGDAFWSRAGFYAIFAGAVAAAMVAVPGFIDWLALPSESDARRAGVVHVALVGSAVMLATLSAVLRLAAGADTFMTLPLVLAIVGVGLLVASGWLGANAVEEGLGAGGSVWGSAEDDWDQAANPAEPPPLRHPREPRPA
jgi:uncharacterized membrane protein